MLPKLNKDGLANTFLISFSVCLFCAILVSFSSVLLKERQTYNRLINKQINVLNVANIYPKKNDDINAIFNSKFTPILVDLSSGTFQYDIDPNYNPIIASKSSTALKLNDNEDIALIKQRESHSIAYMQLNDKGFLEKLILPVRGYGLWGTMYGFIALDSQLKNIVGITFYKHQETPGLGGEIDNPKWKSLWKKVQIYNKDDMPFIKVSKKPSDKLNEVDALSGATLTSNGVQKLLNFWLGELGFQPLINNLSNNNNLYSP